MRNLYSSEFYIYLHDYKSKIITVECQIFKKGNDPSNNIKC